MNRKWKMLLATVLFVAFLGTTYFAYSYLSKRYKVDIGENSSSQITSSDSIRTTGQPDTASNNTTAAQRLNPAPDFTIYDKDNNPVKLSDFSGKPVVLNFWTTWCPSCASELPHFNQVYGEYKNDVVFLMIDIPDGQRETTTVALQYINKKKYDFPFYSDNDQTASEAYAIYYIPDTFFIDADGNIVKSYEGAIDKETLINGIQLIKK